jgi:hypothetical protein
MNLFKTNPYNLRQEFTSINAFKAYLYALPFAELNETLTRFERAEFFQDCVIIEEVIKDKINNNVTP